MPDNEVILRALERLRTQKYSEISRLQREFERYGEMGRPTLAASTARLAPPLDEEADVIEFLIEQYTEEPEEINATDAAIQLAEENGIDISTVEGTGTDGRVLVSDVRYVIGDD